MLDIIRTSPILLLLARDSMHKDFSIVCHPFGRGVSAVCCSLEAECCLIRYRVAILFCFSLVGLHGVGLSTHRRGLFHSVIG